MLEQRVYKHISWVPVICWLLIAIFGWLNIYSSVYSDDAASIFSLSTRSGNQFLWIMMGVVAAVLILFVIPPKLYIGMTWWLYVLAIVLLVAVLAVGKEINGAKSWLAIGPFSLQPSEISKITTSLALAVMMGRYDFRFSSRNSLMKVFGVILLPIGLIALEPDMGTILVYCSLCFMFYREGMTGWLILVALLVVFLFVVTLKFSPLAAELTLIAILGAFYSIFARNTIRSLVFFILFVAGAAFLSSYFGEESPEFLKVLEPVQWIVLLTVPFVIYLLIKGIGKKKNYRLFFALVYIISVAMIFSVQKIFDDVLQQHHRDRIENLLGITQDLKGAGYNVHQSEIAIGSGGLVGKGYLQGTQTKFNFVPEQSTDFIFCTIGEEWGFAGSVLVLAAYLAIIISIISSAERQRDARFRIYGYCVACILFTHVFVNVGMTIGIMPVVGIPLPFISYGGSSFLSFTIMLFIYLRMDLERWR